MTLKEAILKAKQTTHNTVIAQNQETGEYVLFPISSLAIGSEESECYEVAYNNNSIAIAVCSSQKIYNEATHEGEINYTDL